MNLATRSLIAVVFSFSFLVSVSAEGNRPKLKTSEKPVKRQAQTDTRPTWSRACCRGPRHGKPFPYTSLVIEQDSTGGALEQRLRVEKNEAIYGCRPIPGEDVRCCSATNANRLRLHRIHADAVFDTSQVELTGACYMEVDDGAGSPIPQVDPLFGGAELHGLNSFNWDFLNFTPALDGSEFRLDNTGFLEIPDGDDFLKTVSSRDVDALIVLEGQNISELLLEKGIPEARIPQVLERIERIVDGEQFGDLSWPYRSLVNINDDGVLDFVSSTYQQAVVFYEQIEAGESKESDSYDYADASYWFWLLCGDITEENIAPPQEVVIRDSITSDPGYTSWNGYYQAGWSPGSTQQRVLAFEVSSVDGLTLTELQAVLMNSAPPGTELQWSLFDYRIYAWENWDSAFANPTQGTLGTFIIPELIEPQQIWGQLQSTFGPRDTFLVRVDASSTGITVPAGGSVILGFAVAMNGSSGTPEVCESDEQSNLEDFRFNGVSWSSTLTSSRTIHDGRLAVKVIGVTN